jgi:hypothetical protein
MSCRPMPSGRHKRSWPTWTSSVGCSLAGRHRRRWAQDQGPSAIASKLARHRVRFEFGRTPLCSRARDCDAATVQEHPPLGGIRRHGPPQIRLAPQDGQIGDRLPAVGQHHRQIHRNRTRVVARLPLPRQPQAITEPAGQPGGNPTSVSRRAPPCRGRPAHPQRQRSSGASR